MTHNANHKKVAYKSLQQTTLFMLILVMLFFCLMFMITTSIISRKTADDYKKRTSETAVNNVVSTIKATMVNYNYLSRLIMINERVVNYLKTDTVDNDIRYEARWGINEIQNLFSNIDSVYIFRNDGKYVSTGRGNYIINLNDEGCSTILEARGSSVISINAHGMIEKESRKTLLTISRAIYDINSQSLLGILIMNISSNVFDDALSLQNSSGMCIVDINGTLLCGNDTISKLYSPIYNNEDMIYQDMQLSGERKTLTGKLALYPLVVLCVSPESDKLLPFETILALTLPLTAFILSAMLCAWFITTNITKPIKNLSEAMERTKSSGWLKKIDSEMPQNEIGGLAESYNSMIEYLKELINQTLENEKNVQKAEMRVLQEQIKPHFLYNSLETISYMAIQENASQVHDALEILGNFYRNFLSKGDREIPLKRELRITQDYLSLQKMRYDKIFDDEYCIDDASLNCMIPKLILQPLVENAIYHGVRLKGEKGIIRITTSLDDEYLHITVYDSGVGMSDEQIANVLSNNDEDGKDTLSGFGLHGTIDRIRYYCDSNDVVRIRSEQGEYTEVEIVIPRARK